MNHEVCKRVLELSETGLEGLEHALGCAQGGRGNQVLSLVGDVVEAFGEICAVVAPLTAQGDSGEYEQSVDSLNEGLEFLASAYEGDPNLRQLEVLQFTVLPRYRRWCDALRCLLREYVCS